MITRLIWPKDSVLRTGSDRRATAAIAATPVPAGQPSCRPRARSDRQLSTRAAIPRPNQRRAAAVGGMTARGLSARIPKGG
jgi:hypothetical protein